MPLASHTTPTLRTPLLLTLLLAGACVPTGGGPGAERGPEPLEPERGAVRTTPGTTELVQEEVAPPQTWIEATIAQVDARLVSSGGTTQLQVQAVVGALPGPVEVARAADHEVNVALEACWSPPRGEQTCLAENHIVDPTLDDGDPVGMSVLRLQAEVPDPLVLGDCRYWGGARLLDRRGNTSEKRGLWIDTDQDVRLTWTGRAGPDQPLVWGAGDSRHGYEKYWFRSAGPIPAVAAGVDVEARDPSGRLLRGFECALEGEGEGRAITCSVETKGAVPADYTFAFTLVTELWDPLCTRIEPIHVILVDALDFDNDLDGQSENEGDCDDDDPARYWNPDDADDDCDDFDSNCDDTLVRINGHNLYGMVNDGNRIGGDLYRPNESWYYPMPTGISTHDGGALPDVYLQGNLHRLGDQDWYEIHVPEPPGGADVTVRLTVPNDGRDPAEVWWVQVAAELSGRVRGAESLRTFGREAPDGVVCQGATCRVEWRDIRYVRGDSLGTHWLVGVTHADRQWTPSLCGDHEPGAEPTYILEIFD